MILIADASAADRYVLSRILRSKGFEVIEAGDLRTAAALSEKHDFKAVFVDVFLGSDDGFLLSQLLSQKAKAPCVILISARFRHSEDAHSALNSGATAYLDKPFDEAEIQNLLMEQLITPSANGN